MSSSRVIPEVHELWVFKIRRIVIWKIDSSHVPALELNVNYSHPLYDEIIKFTDSTIYQIEKDGCVHDVFMGTLVKQQDTPGRKIPRIEQFYAICDASMKKIDPIIRDFIENRYTISNRSVSIEAVAGSGKTEILLRIAANHSTHLEMKKNILYVAFNKSLVTSIKKKTISRNLPRLHPKTFDSLLYSEIQNR